MGLPPSSAERGTQSKEEALARRAVALDGGDGEVDKIINPPPDNVQQLHESKQ
jgi:hypothetical protein